MPRTSCGAPMAFGCSRWTTAGAGSSPPSSIGTPSVSAGHVCKRGDRFAALQPISMGLAGLYGSTAAGAARGLALRMDHGSQYLSDHFTNQIKFWGIQPSYAFVAEPQTNGVAERFNRTLKEQIIHGRIYRNIAELRDAVRDFVELYNAQWIVEKNGYLSPAQARQAWHAAISIRPAADPGRPGKSCRAAAICALQVAPAGAGDAGMKRGKAAGDGCPGRGGFRRPAAPCRPLRHQPKHDAPGDREDG